MPFRTNLERNSRIYELWEAGKTVEEISRLLGIPRSTAGYYVRKFNQAARKGKSIPLLPPTKTKQENLFLDFYLKTYGMQWLINHLKNDNIQNFYYTLAAFKLFEELWNRLALTEEERKTLQEAMKSRMTGFQGSGQEQSSGKGKTMEELFPDKRQSNTSGGKGKTMDEILSEARSNTSKDLNH